MKLVKLDETFFTKHTKSIGYIVFALFAVLLLTEPAMAAPAWATKVSTVTNQWVTGLKWIAKGIGLGTFIWTALQIIIGNKRFQDAIPWFIGAILLFAADEIVALFFG